MSIGEKLRALRYSAKATLRQQGKLFGVSSNSVYRWEHNLNIPRLPVLKKISEYYNIPVEWLVSGNIEDFESVNTPGSHTAECSTEQKLLRLYRSLSDSCKHKAIGYVEGLSHESISNTQRHQVFNAS